MSKRAKKKAPSIGLDDYCSEDLDDTSSPESDDKPIAKNIAVPKTAAKKKVAPKKQTKAGKRGMKKKAAKKESNQSSKKPKDSEVKKGSTLLQLWGVDDVKDSDDSDFKPKSKPARGNKARCQVKCSPSLTNANVNAKCKKRTCV